MVGVESPFLKQFSFFLREEKEPRCTNSTSSVRPLSALDGSLHSTLYTSMNSLSLSLSLTHTLALTHMHARMHWLTRVHPHALTPIYSNVGECDSNVSIHFLASASEKKLFSFSLLFVVVTTQRVLRFPGLGVKGTRY